MPLSMWLRDAGVSSYVLNHYLAVGLCDVVPVKDPPFTIAHHRVSNSLVVRASGLIMEGRGFKSHPELKHFFQVHVIFTFNSSITCDQASFFSRREGTPDTIT